MNDKITIIVPVYNVEKYLENAVQSIVVQTYKNLDIILIDDGSTDSSGNICDSLKINDSRIRVYHKKNGGLSDARNYGISKAKGKFITFVDSDDIVSSTIIEKMYNLIIKHDADISIVELRHFCDDEDYYFDDEKNVKEFTSDEANCEMLYQNSFSMSACGKLFKREIFDKLSYPVGMLFEDVAIMYKAFDFAKRIVYSDAKLYGYRHRSNSITTNSFSIRDLDIIIISNQILEYFMNKSNSLIKASQAYALNCHFRILMNIPNNNFEKYKRDSELYIKTNCKKVLSDKNIRNKLKYAIIGYLYFKPFLKFAYSRIDRWK